MPLKNIEQSFRAMRVPVVTILAREMWLKIFWSWPSLTDVARTASHDIGARNAIDIFFLSRPSFGDVASTTSHDISARNAIEIFWSRPSLGNVASTASYDNGARNAIEIFWSRPNFGDVTSAGSVTNTRYCREKCDWNYFEVDQTLEM